MRTEQAVTDAGGIPVGYATLAAVYALVALGVVWILRRLALADTPGGTRPPTPTDQDRVER
jgi:hypothetical protein